MGIYASFEWPSYLHKIDNVFDAAGNTIEDFIDVIVSVADSMKRRKRGKEKGK